jgi:nicotinate-nucleotide adenylyltransferase
VSLNALSFGSVRVKPPLAFPGQRIGIMGGTFNPPHEGHLLVSRTAIRRLKLDRLWWLVTPGNPLKNNTGLTSLDARLDLCRLLAHDEGRIDITSFEAELGTPYTAATLRYLKRRLPDVRFVWVMGADNLAGFDRWQRWRDIAQMMPIAVVDRPGWHLKSLAQRTAMALARSRVPEGRAGELAGMTPPAWTFLSGPLSSLSSTDIRAGRAVAKRIAALQGRSPSQAAA